MDPERYYTSIAAAFIRGALNTPEENEQKLWQLATENGLKLHKFKRNRELPRIAAVLGMLKQIQPHTLLDIGSGRGVFLWPLLDSFPHLHITATDIQEQRIQDIQAIHNGGFTHLNAQYADVNQLPFTDNEYDAVTALETIEHLDHPTQAIQEVVRVAHRHAIFSVPSKEDSNPEHLHVLTQNDFEAALNHQPVRLSYSYVLNHMIVFVTKHL